MTARIHEWTQREWSRAGIELFASKGDFYSTEGLYPDRAGRKLRRAPGWSSYIQWTTNFGKVMGAFYDRANDRCCFIGQGLVDDHLWVSAYNSSWTVAATGDLALDVSGAGALQGAHQRNAIYWGGYLWAISGASDVYQIANYAGSSTTSFWTGTAQALTAYGDFLYLANSAGQILRTDASLAAFESYHDPPPDLDIRFMAPFHQYLCVFGRTLDGTIAVYRVPDTSATALHQIAALQTSAREPTASPYTDGNLYLVHGDRIYFTSGWYPGTTDADVYAFDGSTIRHVAHLAGLPTYANTRSAGLLSWRDELLFYAFDSTASSQYIKMLVGDSFVDFCKLNDLTLSTYSTVYNVAGNLVVPAKSGAGGVECFFRPSGLQDGNLITSRLDFGQPGRLKRLERLTALVDGSADHFGVNVFYRTDDTTSWTTAITSDETRRFSADLAGVTFYLLQLKVTFTDSTAANKDYALEAISVVYTIDD